MASGKNRNKSEFIRRYELAMKKRGFSEDKAVAEAAGISAPAISGWRKGPSWPSVRALRSVADALHVPFEWLNLKSNSDPNWEECVNEEPVEYQVRKEFRAGSTKAVEIPGIHDASDEVIEENADYFYNELVKPFGCKARPANITSLIQYTTEMLERSVKHWHEKSKGKKP